MESTSDIILYGVLSSVLSSFLLYALFFIKIHIFDRWLENLLYKGVILSGSWDGKKVRHYKNSSEESTDLIHDELKMHLELKQVGYNITGIFTAEAYTSTKNTKDVYNNFYTISGHIHDNFLVLEYHPSSRKRTGLGSFVLEVKNGGNQLIGDVVFVDEGDMEIVSVRNITFKRDQKF
jgi:hypothetical protein